MKLLAQERTAAGQIFPWPEAATVITTTPPAFRWLPVAGGAPYTLIVATAAGREVIREVVSANYVLLRTPLAPGRYTWDVLSPSLDAARGAQAFTIAENATPYCVPTPADLFAALPAARPRHIFTPQTAAASRARHAGAVAVLRRNIALALEAGLPPRPLFHRDPEALPYREAFGRHRDYVDRDLVACALGHLLLGDEAAAAHARACLLTLCDWNPEGPCSVQGPWGDEFGLSHCRCLPAVFDWLHDCLTDGERDYVARTLAQYGRQMEERLRGLDFPAHPGNSHAGRLPAYLGEMALVLHGTGVVAEAELTRWLQYALDIFGAIFPFYGGRDGGWAEGPFYASSYTKWYQPFFFAVEQLTGFSFFEQPFYRQVSQFFLHCGQPAWECRPFSDGYWCQPDDAEWPGFCAQDPFGVYAERFGPPAARALSEQVKPALYKLHLLDVFRPPFAPMADRAAGPAENSRAFRDAGYVSLHSRIEEPAADVALLARASRYGTASHQHADQGNFAILAGGKMLVGPSGYFGRSFGTAHHTGWTQQTQAHNCILVDGAGQAARSHAATGRIVSLEDDGVHAEADLDLNAAYPGLTRCRRRLRLDREALVITVQDSIEAEEPVAITWLLHALSPPQAEDGALVIARGRAVCRITLADERGAVPEARITDRWGVDLNEGVPEPYRVECPVQHHMRWDFAPAAQLRLTARFALAWT